MILVPVVSGGAGVTSVLGWGAGSIGSTITTRYLYPWYSEQLAEVGEVGIRVPRRGVLKNLRILHTIPSGNGATISYIVRVGGLDSLVQVNLASTAVSGDNIIDSVNVLQGDLVSIKVEKPLNILSSPRNVVVTAEFV